jgi:hypothetical protein
MIATAYVQIVPHRNSSGVPTSLRIVKLTQGPPREPEPGALLAKLSIDIDKEVFIIPTLHVELDGDPLTLSMGLVPYPVAEDAGEVAEDAGEGEVEA